MPANEEGEKVIFRFSSKDALGKIKAKINRVVTEGSSCRIAVTNQAGEEVVNLSIPSVIGIMNAAVEYLSVAVKDAPAFLANCTITVLKKEESKSDDRAA